MLRGLRLLVASIAFAISALDASNARAEPDPNDDTETVDGVDDCARFQEKNLDELEKFEKARPPTPYRYPRESVFMHAPWGTLFRDAGHGGELVLATFLPHIGAQFRGDAPAAVISLPWTILILGPMYSCSRRRGTFNVRGHRAHRVLVEPILVSGKQGIGFAARYGYRFIFHPSTWVVGPGLGIGSTVDIAGNKEPFRYSVSPEAVLHFGHCCGSSYFTLAARYDHYFEGRNVDIVGANLGYTFF